MVSEEPLGSGAALEDRQFQDRISFLRKCPDGLRGTPRYWGCSRRPAGAGRQGNETRVFPGISPWLRVIRNEAAMLLDGLRGAPR